VRRDLVVERDVAPDEMLAVRGAVVSAQVDVFVLDLLRGLDLNQGPSGLGPDEYT